MSGLALVLRQIRYENRSFWRNPPAAFFTFVFPLIFLVIFNAFFGNDRIDVPGGSTRMSTFYVPAIAALSVINACFTGLAMSVSLARDQGLLKRIRGTPLPAWAFLVGRVGHMALVALLLVAIVTAAGALFYGVDVPTRTLPAAIVTLAIGAAAFASLGLAVTALIPSADAAPAGSDLLGDLGTVQTYKIWLEPVRFIGLGTLLVGISLAVHTILQVIRFQGQRIRELAAGR